MNRERKQIERGIYMQPGSDHLYVCCSDGKGGVIRRSTGTTSIVEARKQRNKLIAEVEAGKPTTPKQQKVTVGDLFAMIRADYEINGQCLRPLETALKRLGAEFRESEPALAVTANRVAAYAAARLKEGYSRATVRQDLSILKRAFNVAVELGRLASVPVIKPPSVNNARKGFLDHSEFQRLHDALPPDLRDPVAFLYYSGWRVSEMRSLEWRDIQGAVGRLDPAKSKNKEGRILPLVGELAEIVGRCSQSRLSSCPFVFHRDNGLPVGLFRKSWASALRKSGLGHILVHDLRRCAVRNLVQSGIPEKTAMTLTGHKTRAIFDRYHIVCEADLAEAAERMQNHLASQPVTTAKVVALSRAA